MIHEAQGSIFDSPAIALVNPVNCVGVMGSGLAAEFKRRYPKYFLRYRNACDKSLLRPGQVMFHACVPGWVVSFPTKDHWRNKSRWSWIYEGLSDLRKQMIDLEIPSVAVPALGCGLGGLPWPEVKLQIKTTLEDAPFDTYLYGPQG